MTKHEVNDMFDQRDAKNNELTYVYNWALESFVIVGTGIERAITEIDAPDVPRTDMTLELLGKAVTLALAAASGGATAWVTAGVAVLSKQAVALVKSVVTSAVTDALKAPAAKRAASMVDLKKSFARLMDVQRLEALDHFNASWPAHRAQLVALPTDDLKSCNRLSRDSNKLAAYEAILRTTMIEWTNFLARAKHGAMGPWDSWDPGGNGGAFAVKLKDSKPGPDNHGTADPTQGNVSPAHLGQGEQYGVLEIFLDAETHKLVPYPGFGMRLENVGPNVRAELAKIPRVGELPVNKVVKLCSPTKPGSIVPPNVVASILITADGYVRGSSGFDRIHFEPQQGPLWDPMGFGDCMGTLRGGRETDSCHFDRPTYARDVGAIAEIAQSLPLSIGGTST